MAKKQETIRVAQYLLSKDKKTKYLKFGYGPKADQATREMVDRLIEVLGTDRLYINIFDEDFKAQHKIQDFVVGSVAAPIEESRPSTVRSVGGMQKKRSNVDF